MSYQVIARKYRPQAFDEVVGQALITETLKNAIVHQRVAHGYIFSGARGVGKTTTARILAKALNCAQGPTVTPCGVCHSCREISAGNSVDVLEIDAASNRGIDEIRELRETVRYLPARDRYKVFIIDEVHMLTTEAFNALLKTLEEPPPRSLFILATTEAHKLPTTIQSRCQHFAFRLLDYQEIYSRLAWVCEREGITADEGSLGAIAEAAEGSVRDALSLLDQVIAACGERLDEARVRQVLGVVPTSLLSEVVEAIQAADSSRVLAQVDRLASEGYELAAFCAEFTRYVRNLMIARTCGAASPLLQVPGDARDTLARHAASLSEEDLARFFNILLRAQNEMRYSLQPRFHLELALMKLVHARRLASLEGLLSELGSASRPNPVSGGPSGGRPAVAAPPVAPGGGHPAAKLPLSPPARASAPSASPAAPGPGTAASTAAPAREAPQAAKPLAATPMPAEAEASSPAAEDPRLAAIKAALFEQSKKFVGSCLEHVSGWRFEDGEVRFIYSRRNSGTVWADLLKGRESQEALRTACARVFGRPVSVYVTLEEDSAGAPARPNARQRAEVDGRVVEFKNRFDCVWVDVTDLTGSEP